MAALRLVLVLLWVGVAASSVVDLQKRIIGGQPCGQRERLYHVLLELNGNICGGSLLQKKWILTAAHCWEPGWRIFVTLGVHTGSPQRVEITAPPKIYKTGLPFIKKQHDLMLLKLPDSAQIPAGVRPIDLPPDCDHHPGLNEIVKIAGHGSTTTGPYNTRQPKFTPTLQCADIHVVDCTTTLLKAQIHHAKSSMRKLDYQHWFCGQTPRVDTCDGDSGGGVEYNKKIYGVISFTGDGKYACSRPAGFMKICHANYLNWIKDTIDPTPSCLNCFG